jgi:hypothetical protein
MCRT